jgi:hypothetical protein
MRWNRALGRELPKRVAIDDQFCQAAQHLIE